MTILTLKCLFISIYVAKGPPELYKICNQVWPGGGERGQKWPKLPQFCKGDPLRSSSKENLLTKIDAIKVLHVAHNLFVIFLRLGTILGNDSADVASDSFDHQTGE